MRLLVLGGTILLGRHLVEETVLDTLIWDRGRPAGTPRRAGIGRGREAELRQRAAPSSS